MIGFQTGYHYLNSHFNRFSEGDHQNYMRLLRAHEPIRCPICSALYKGGRWQWGKPEGEPRCMPCPACLRIQDKFPAGLLSIPGDFVCDHMEDIERVLHAVEQKEMAQHPLRRIMGHSIDGTNTLQVQFTDRVIARVAAEALVKAYSGYLEFDEFDSEYLMVVEWHQFQSTSLPALK